MSPTGGYNKFYAQTGEVRNRGVELSLEFKNTWNKFTWNSNYTFSANKNKILSLIDGYVNPVTGETISKERLEVGGLANAKFLLKVGGSLGDLYSVKDLVRDSNNNIYVDEEGKVAINEKAGDIFLGSVFPKANMAWRNDFQYAQQCTAVILDNGEQLPTLRQYLEKAGQLKTRLILELKSHKTPEQETRAVESIVKMVKDMGLENRMEYIAFSRHATKEFIRLTPKGTPVYYLEGDLSPKELKEWGCAGPDYHFSVFKRHPEWIKESHDLGMKVNAWTINDAKDMKWLIDHGVDFITTNVPVELQEILQ